MVWPGEKTRFSRRRHLLRDPAGLTLLEVLIAMAILGIGLAVIMQGLALGLKVRRDSAETQAMSQVAENRLNRLLDEGSFAADDEGSEGPYLWRLEELSTEGGSERVVNLRVVVDAPSGRTWELHTLFPRREEEP